MKHDVKRYGSFFALLFAAMLLAGCPTGVIKEPQTFEQKLAYAYGQHTAVMNAAASAVEVGTLSLDDAKAVLRMADDSRMFLDAARGASGSGDLTTAEGQLALATNVLTQLSGYLNSRSVK